MTHESEQERDSAADAIRARQSLEGEDDLGGAELVGPGFSAGERHGVLGDLEETDADEALDDDDVELDDHE